MRYGAEILMMFKNNNFIRLCNGLIILLSSLFVESKEFDYRFQWLSLPVASLSIDFDELSHVNNDIKPHITNFKLSTQGPLRLYRKYSSQGYIKYDPGISWDYYLSGNDRGQPEEKHITYFYNMAPKIRKFIDDKGVDPILIDPLLDIGAIDPFTALTSTIQQLKNEKTCNNIFFVMDGKRRNEVKLLFIDKNDISLSKTKLQGDIYHCQFKLSNRKTIELNKTKKQWPFEEKDKRIDVWFSERLDFIPVKFEFQGPFGKIEGLLVE